jgi:DegV family protein with EDD domain
MFEKLRGKVAGVVAITLSSDLPAAAYQSALIAKEVVGDLPIEVIDSRLSTVAFGLVVLAAARAAAEGAGMEEIVKVTRETMSKMHVFFTVGTLDYFKRTGRVSLPHGLGEEKVATKYILTFREGKVVPIERPRTRTQALQRVLELFEENVSRDSPLHVAVQHADSLEEAEELKNKIASRYQCAELWIANATPVMATHLSPGTVGVGFYNE